ncbi:hypothetical protein BGW41_003130 [Actinomortierella wolfii]|nr:hypothetical protein BGW41_003130 [Actinomortierella wolfii]
MVNLHIAVISGPQYDRLYERLAIFEQQTGHKVTIVFRGSHPELNEYLAKTFPAAANNHAKDEASVSSGDSPCLDLISTHIKYAPSQAHFLLPLDEATEVSPCEQAEFIEAALQACRVHGKLMQLPRMIDSRVLFYRRDLFERAGVLKPSDGDHDNGEEDDEVMAQFTWQDLVEIGRQIQEAKIPVSEAMSPWIASQSNRPQLGIDNSSGDGDEGKGKESFVHGYVFPGKQSGLFGTFYELAMMTMKDPSALFDAQTGQPVMDVEVVAKVLEYLRDLVQSGVVPDNIEEYYFDEVSRAFQEGKVVIVADWPSFFGDLKKQLLEWWTQEHQYMREHECLPPSEQQHDHVDNKNKQGDINLDGNNGGGDGDRSGSKRSRVRAPSSSSKSTQQPMVKVGVMRYCRGWNGTRSAYSGMHSFALPRSCRHRPEAIQLLKFLVADDQQWLEASESGSFPTKKHVLERLKRETRIRAEKAYQTLVEMKGEVLDDGVEIVKKRKMTEKEEDTMVNTQSEETEARDKEGSFQGHRDRTQDHKSDAAEAATAAKAAAALTRLEVRRLECLTATIESDMAMFPHLGCYAELEDELYPVIQDAMMGRQDCREAAKAIQVRAQEIAVRSEE